MLRAVAEAVKADVALETLDLHSCAVGNEGARALAEGLAVEAALAAGADSFRLTETPTDGQQ